MKLTRLAFCGLLAAGSVFAQNSDSLEIRGIVLESGMNGGVAEAEINVYQFSKALERSVFATGMTDPHGNFLFHPTQSGNYYVEAKKPAYFATGPGSSIEVVIDDQAPVLTGVVTEGGQPANQPKIYVNGWPAPSTPPVGMDRLPSTVGDKEGRFQITGLPPGEYRVLALPSGPIPEGENEWNITPNLWDRAEAVTLERGKQKEIVITLTDPLLQ